MRNRTSKIGDITRRQLLKAGLYGIGAGAAGSLHVSSLFARTAEATASQSTDNGRIFVVLELSGGNDGLNTLVHYGDDAYYRLRPNIGLPADSLRKIDDHFGFNPGVVGFERLYKEGKMAVIHGCGYENPSFSHFSSMAYWHTAAPNSGEEYGWVGRLADSMAPGGAPNFLMNIDTRQSLAVRSREHTPVVFDDPNKFAREGFYQENVLFAHVSELLRRRTCPNGSCVTSPVARTKRPPSCGRPGRTTARRPTTGSTRWTCPRSSP